MIDRKLLELAAKAVGVAPVLCYESARNCLRIGDRKGYALWRPITDDGDALRLAVKLEIDLWFGCGGLSAHGLAMDIEEDYGRDRCAATRRAIVRAAAAIGEAMP